MRHIRAFGITVFCLTLLFTAGATPQLSAAVIRLPLIVRDGQAALDCDYWAKNHTNVTTCAEEDNVNVPLFGGGPSSRWQIVATHPAYNIAEDNCAADFSGCGASVAQAAPGCVTAYDDGAIVLKVCEAANWWRPYHMTVEIAGAEYTGDYIELYHKIEGAAEWPSFLVLYQDGNLRLIPHPPVGKSAVCYGSSVLIGPAQPAPRPYADIARLVVQPNPLTLSITYRDDSAAVLTPAVNRQQATVDVAMNAALDAPVLTFRSMWIDDGNCDASLIQNSVGDWGLRAGEWNTLCGPWWRFHRAQSSRHNTSAPDIQISSLAPGDAAP